MNTFGLRSNKQVVERIIEILQDWYTRIHNREFHFGKLLHTVQDVREKLKQQ